MTTYFPVSYTVPQYSDANGDPYSGAVLKAYSDGTSTPINLATDYLGGTLVSTMTLNAAGYPEVSGNIVIPHAAENLKLALYPTAAAAAANTGEIWMIDNIRITSGANSAGVLEDVASATTIVLNSTTTNYFNITGTTTITGITLAEGVEVTVKFAGILTLTNGANLINLTGANITTAAGDIAVFRGEAAGVVRMLDYARLNPYNGISNGGVATNRYYHGFGYSGNTTGTQTVTANRHYAAPFYVADTDTFTKIGMEITTGAAGAARLGVYTWVDGLPGDLVLDCGTVDTTSIALVEAAISLTLTPGTYAVTAVFNATPTVRNKSGQAIVHHFFGEVGNAGSSDAPGSLYKSFTYGALPASFGGSVTYVNISTAPISLWLRKV